MYHSIAIGKGVLSLSKILNRDGSTWPGHLALKADRNFIKKTLNKNSDIKIILVAGTNGKTTTTKALSHILEKSGISVLTNKSGANLLNGLASLLVKHIRITGTLHKKAIIFEVDENTLPILLQEIEKPDAIILLNLFRDQLDRYGEVNTTAEKWKEALSKLKEHTVVIGNADDPQIAFLTLSTKNKIFYSIDNTLKNEETLSHAVDSTTCPQCMRTLSYTRIAYSHLGNYSCSGCGFTNPKSKRMTFTTKLLGAYNIYNLTSAIVAADKIFNITPYASSELLKTFEPAFGRQEVLEVEGKKVMLLLSKNPTGLNESLNVVLQNNSYSLLFLLNDRIPDGRDISWIWDVDFEKLKKGKFKIFVSGDRGYDLANRLLFANVDHEVFDNYETAYRKALEKTPDKKVLTILPTYSAMLEIRKLIGGKSLL